LQLEQNDQLGRRSRDLGCGAAGTTDAAAATSAAASGMDALIAAAKGAGTLNVIARPHGWASYGEIIDAGGLP